MRKALFAVVKNEYIHKFCNLCGVGTSKYKFLMSQYNKESAGLCMDAYCPSCFFSKKLLSNLHNGPQFYNLS